MEVEVMKKFAGIIAGVGAVLLANEAFATQPYNVEVRDHQKTVIKRTPQVVEVCSERKVSGDKTADTILGAIIGGAIGQNITKDLPDGATAGAIIGGILGNQNSTANDGTKLVCNKMTRYKESMETIYSHSTITFNYYGKTYTVRFQK
tara:strand:- start:3 stop:446 length:444 start_codon:yes stop_codon:yes gene_type:complete